ncbi:MAG: glutamine synthetase III [Kiritimatiellae bacterium]|nr:glutamine synthetase III [Kiritimatiellia bacterium]
MSNCARLAGIKKVASMKGTPPQAAEHVSTIPYAEDVFSIKMMKQYLAKDTYKKLAATITRNTPLDASIAGEVAHAMKEWALDRGCTHYTHWFQPLTGVTAEKHDSFVDFDNGEPIMSFSGKNLIVGEPDASSFPSGGIRSTAEARGYTAWDPTSPAFIKRHGSGATLCIPTAFCSYTGEALDKKTPLLRSMQALSASTKRLMKCFGMPDENVTITLGVEQEYFLVDKAFYLARPDLVQCGRTLFGAASAKHQQLEDHYFGSIPGRILDFMHDVEIELWKLGIPAKTRHNEVAPAQFELAPLFETVNVACDHNMLVMETLQQVADRHGLVCLLHEKPFAGVNGSGKHNNWSVNYGKKNLLNPGDNPQDNAVFLTVLTAIIAAIDKHADLLRCSVASAANDHRLGANEAPPAIISMYLGDQLAAIVDSLEKGTAAAKKSGGVMKVGVDMLPPLPKDSTDRNRTSPFAFTGNKFEFRAPGSSQSCSSCNTVLDTIVAEAFDEMADVLETFPAASFHTKLQDHLREVIKAHKRVIFNGDGYTAEWPLEAAKRGLPNARTAPEAAKAFLKEENIALYEKYKVLNRRELESRYEIAVEDYTRRLAIEANMALDIAGSMILPAAKAEYSETLDAYAKAEATGIASGTAALKAEAIELGAALDALRSNLVALSNAIPGKSEGIVSAMTALRTTVDTLEKRIADDKWPLPKYREMLFVY